MNKYEQIRALCLLYLHGAYAAALFGVPVGLVVLFIVGCLFAAAVSALCEPAKES